MPRFQRRGSGSRFSPPPSQNDPYRLTPVPAPQGDEAAGFAWSFGREEEDPRVIEHQPRAGGRGAASFAGPDGRHRAAAVGRHLELALDRWWARGELPPQALLRDGLLALEAGHPVGEGQRTLLLRAALARGRGMLTALGHQTDPDRTAEVIKEALLDPRPRLAGGSLPVDAVRRLRQEDPNGALWGGRLLQALAVESNLPLEPRRSQAAWLLAQLQGQPLAPLPQEVRAGWVVPQALWIGQPILALRPRFANLWAALFLFLALSLLGGGIWLVWQQGATQTHADQLLMPAGIYPISDPAQPGSVRMVQAAAFRLDRTEVTNRAYRGCYEAGVCSLPAGTSLGGGSNPLLEPDKQDHPVSEVTWAQAGAYCAWLDQRLPLEEEWEIGAAVAPASLRRFIYPWGDFFQPRWVAAVGQAAAASPVGSFSPGGDSPFGAADMAGNVAEWTATLLEPGVFVVKGGSYLDDALGLRTDSWQALPAETAAPWLGFRCAVTGE